MKSAQLDPGIREELREFYATSREYAEHLAAENEGYFTRYLNLVDSYGRRALSLLDAGCGTGLSTYLFSQRKPRVVGLDLSELFLRQGREREGARDLSLVGGDILDLPFRDASFDLVGSYLVMEFLPDVQRGLEEMIRVLKKDGVLLIVAPNLLSPIWPLLDFFRQMGGGAGRPVWCETPQAALGRFMMNGFLTLAKLCERNPRFLYRRPDLTCSSVVGRDSDSVYLACPIDIARFLRQRGFRILRSGSAGNWVERLFPAFSVAVEVVAEKL